MEIIQETVKHFFYRIRTEMVWLLLSGINLKVPVFSSSMRSATLKKLKLPSDQAKQPKETQERIFIEFQARQNEYRLAVENYFTNKENLALPLELKKKSNPNILKGLAVHSSFAKLSYNFTVLKTTIIKSIQNVCIKN